MSGKEIRMRKIMNKDSNKMIIIPVDHGATVGPISQITNIGKFLGDLDEKYVNGVVLCKGQMGNKEVIEKCRIPKIVHLSNASVISSKPNNKILVGSVENAIALGADAISIHVNIGDENDDEMLRAFGKISDDCYKWGMPLLAMMYARKNNEEDIRPQTIKILARIAQEMGADIVKVNYTGDPESFHEVVEGCSIPIIIAGGGDINEKQALENAYNAVRAGAAGVAYGRNVFQHENYNEFVKKLYNVVNFGKIE